MIAALFPVVTEDAAALEAACIGTLSWGSDLVQSRTTPNAVDLMVVVLEIFCTRQDFAAVLEGAVPFVACLVKGTFMFFPVVLRTHSLEHAVFETVRTEETSFGRAL